MDNEKEMRELRDKVIEGAKRSRKKLIAFKREKNSPLVVSKNGKIVHLKA